MKTAILVVIAIILVGGGAFVAASLNLVQVPGISPTKFGKPLLASKDESRGPIDYLATPLKILSRAAEAEEAKKPKPEPQKELPVDKTNPEVGDKKLAEIWNGLEPEKLVEITKNWPELGLAKVLLKMDSDQVTAYLAVLTPDKAKKVSLAIQTTAAKVVSPETATS